ncbi:MAG: endoribonuclease MazF [Leptospirillum sp.]
MSNGYVPEAGDIVWLNFDPKAGHEQAGRRPALVISPSVYNQKTGLLLCCPMTSRIKGYPFEVTLSGDTSSAILADQVKNLDWVAREASLKERVSPDELLEVRAKIFALIGVATVMGKR